MLGRRTVLPAWIELPDDRVGSVGRVSSSASLISTRSRPSRRFSSRGGLVHRPIGPAGDMVATPHGMHLSLGPHQGQDPQRALADAVDLRLLADAVERLAVARAVAQGWGWARIAEPCPRPRRTAATATPAAPDTPGSVTSDRCRRPRPRPGRRGPAGLELVGGEEAADDVRTERDTVLAELGAEGPAGPWVPVTHAADLRRGKPTIARSSRGRPKALQTAERGAWMMRESVRSSSG